MATVIDRLDKYLDNMYEKGHLLTELALSPHDTAAFIAIAQYELKITVDRKKDKLYYKYTQILI